MAKKRPKASTDTPPVSARQKAVFDNLLKVTYEFIKGKHYKPQSKESLIDKLRIHSDHFAIFDHVLKSLHTEGKVAVAEQKYLSKSEDKPAQDIVKGLLRVHPRGFGFVVIEGSDEPDIFIPKPYINNAIDGDIVEVLINRETVSEKGPDGQVLHIIQRKRTHLIGTVTNAGGHDKAWVYAALLGSSSEAEVLLEKGQKVHYGDRLLLEVIEWGTKAKPTRLKIASVLGNVKDASQDIAVALLEHEIRNVFPEEALQEAKRHGTKVALKDIKNREDLRDVECFTIDPDTAKDYDDAISVQKDKNGYTIGIHIADVSHYVRAGSSLDKEARLRCNSTYFPGKCVPMLPSELSDNLCSLKEGVNRLTVSVFVTIDHTGAIRSSRISKTVIKSQKRFTYKLAKKVLDGSLKSKHKSTLEDMVKVCGLLKQKRKLRGSVELYMPELVVTIGPDGMPTGTEVVAYDITHQMVEEFMLLANEIVATTLSKAGKELTYRVHEEPAKESLREFAALGEAFGYKLPPEPSPHDIQKFFVSIEGEPFAQYLATCYIRSMRLACYSADNIGHYGLSLKHYCHFTSPIRRYVDIIAHRLLFEPGYDKKTVELICSDASEKERLSAKAEHSVLALKKLRLLKELSKEHKWRQFKAIVTRVKPFGIYFDVLELMLEGYLHVSELENDYFTYDERAGTLVGRHHQYIYRAGDTLTVMVKNIDFVLQSATWYLAPAASSKKKKKK